ncbi:MAG: oxidoreductase [Acidimicrobiaceae bacterium]|nr:oxidoreductase [Acidimicrobiaceae bacterium]
MGASGAYIPVIDLAPTRTGDPDARAAVAADIDRACRESGFLVVTGHDVDPELVQRLHDVTLELFRQPDDWKQRWDCAPDTLGLRGFYRVPSYVSAGEDVATAPDVCELFTMSRLGEPGVADGAGLGDAADRYGIPNIWPDRPAELRAVWLEYYGVMEALAADLMRLFALGLGLDEGTFDEAIDQHITNLTANYYPAVDHEPLPDQYRKGPHSDWGTLTILYQDGTGGLEVVDRRTGGWIDVPVIPGTFVVNIGDLMARWTNDHWNSTKHRVRVPSAELRSTPRVSIPFFHHPNYDALVECLPSCTSADDPPKYPPVTAGAYLDDRVRAVYTG